MNAGILPPPSQYATPPRSIGGAPARPVQTPGGIGEWLDWRRPNWSVTQDALYAGARASNWQFGTRVAAATVTAVTDNYVGTILSPGGLVWATPYAATGGLVFDPNNNTTYVVGSFGGTLNFTSGVLMPDGKVFVVPRSSTTARIVDLVNKTVTTPAATFPGSNAFLGGTVCDGGRKIYLAPGGQRTTGGVYDIASQTFTTPAGTFSTGVQGNTSAGAFLLPDNRVFVAPSYSTAAIYDPASDRLTTSALSLGYNGSVIQYLGAVMLASGDEIALIPFNATAITIYNWRRDTARTVTGTATGFTGGQLCPDGSVFCVPATGTVARVYRPDTGTVSALPDTYSGSSPVAGANVLPDGRLVMMPRSDSAVRTYGAKGSVTFDTNVTMSPYYNHR